MGVVEKSWPSPRRPGRGHRARQPPPKEPSTPSFLLKRWVVSRREALCVKPNQLRGLATSSLTLHGAPYCPPPQQRCRRRPAACTTCYVARTATQSSPDLPVCLRWLPAWLPAVAARVVQGISFSTPTWETLRAKHIDAHAHGASKGVSDTGSPYVDRWTHSPQAVV